MRHIYRRVSGALILAGSFKARYPKAIDFSSRQRRLKEDSIVARATRNIYHLHVQAINDLPKVNCH
ncbi:MAG TPA: hypothetical protein VID27_23335 [Blastocatellia bacterium]